MRKARVQDLARVPLESHCYQFFTHSVNIYMIVQYVLGVGRWYRYENLWALTARSNSNRYHLLWDYFVKEYFNIISNPWNKDEVKAKLFKIDFFFFWTVLISFQSHCFWWLLSRVLAFLSRDTVIERQFWSFSPSLLFSLLNSTLCDPMDCSPAGFSVHGILQARIVEWVTRFLLQGIFWSHGSSGRGWGALGVGWLEDSCISRRIL